MGGARKSAEKKKETPAPAPSVSPAAQETETEAAESDEELAAAITAAVAAFRAAEGEYTGGFRVVSFRKAKTKPSWNKQ